jgi:glycosyltransferase involved in cell wall biosynthesis
VFASNPSLVLTYLLLAARIILRFRFASDAHYGGVISVSGSRFAQQVLDYANRHADRVIVTNSSHAQRVRSIGGVPLVCPDPLPELREQAFRPPALSRAKKTALLVCTFEVDEPFAAVFEAARQLVHHGFTVLVSGRYDRAGLFPEAVPHVTLLGYVDRRTYESYLRHVDLVLDFTTWEDCLVCGAYEAMAAGRPSVLSRTAALTELFTGGAVFSSHEPSDIVRAVVSAYEQRDALMSQIPEWRRDHERTIAIRTKAIRDAVGLNGGH